MDEDNKGYFLLSNWSVMRKFIKLLLPLVFLSFCISCTKPAGKQNHFGQSSSMGRIALNTTIQISYDITWDEDVTDFYFVAIVPTTIEGRQKVLDVRYPRKIGKLFKRDGNTYFECNIRTRQYSERSLQLDFYVDVSLFKFETMNNVGWKGEKEFEKYLSPDGLIDSDAPEIQEASLLLKNTEDIATMRNVYDFVNAQITNPQYGTELSAVEALEKHEGDCTEYSTLAAALLRASNIPTMVVYGILIEGVPIEGDEAHAWNEVYTRRYGWLAIDMTDDIYEYANQRFHYVYFSNKYYGDANLKGSAVSYCKYNMVSPSAKVYVTSTYKVLSAVKP